MKKRLIAILVLLVMAIFALTSCNIFFNPVVPQFKVTFETNGAEAIDSQEVPINKTVTQPTDPTKEGYTFTGWYKDADLTRE